MKVVAPDEVQVLEEVLALFKQRGGFTTSTYQRWSTDAENSAGPGSGVVACCAVGGIEQAVWKLTGKTVGHSADGYPAARSPAARLYNRVLQRVNRIQAQLYPRDEEGFLIENIEQLTFRFHGIRQPVRSRVIRVFELALQEARGE